MAELDAILMEDDIVVADASYATNWVTSYPTARKPGMRFLTPWGLAGLGWGLPMALGASLARRPDARVFALVGDGGFGHCWSELETARRMRIPVVATDPAAYPPLSLYTGKHPTDTEREPSP